MAGRRPWRVGLLGAWLGVAACSSPEPGGPPSPPPYDDDTTRLSHCSFEPAPPREALPALEPASLRAGIGSAVVELPIGTPAGGYGGRVHGLGSAEPPDDRAARWATGMTVTVGLHDAPRADALALEAGEERFILVRVDVPFVTEDALFALEQALAADGSLRGRVMLTASHSHGAWAAWIPTFHLVPGSDRPRLDLFDRVVAAMRAAAQAALDDLQEAKLGLAVEPAFDPTDTVTEDRRPDNDEVTAPDGSRVGHDKDPVAWAVRIDTSDGQPRAAVVNVPIHGTVGTHANPLISTDAPGAITRALEAELGVPVLHVQGVAGDLAPAAVAGRGHCPDTTRCLDVPALEILGARAAALLAPLVEGIETESRAAIEVVTRSFPVGRGGVVRRPDGYELWYRPPDPEAIPDGVLFAPDGRAAVPFDEFNTVSGAGMCGTSGGSFASLPGTAGLLPYGSCIDLDTGADLVLSLFDLPPVTLPLCDSVRATGAAVRIGLPDAGEWLLVGAPGEPTAPFAAYLRNRSPAGPERTLIVGYADEYTGYLLTAEDWLSGGYECSTNLWGPREGEQVLGALVEIAELAWSPDREDPEAGSARHVGWEFPFVEAVDAVVTSDHGTALIGDEPLWWPDTLSPAVGPQPAASVPRAVGVARFAWLGGDPAVDFPVVVVERELGPGQFEPLMDGLARPVGSQQGAVVVTYTPAPLEAPAPSQHQYAATWQPTSAAPLLLANPLGPLSLPLGRYRLTVSGKALGPDGQEPYSLSSAAFDVTEASLDSSSAATRTAAAIELSALLPAPPGLRAVRDGICDEVMPLPGPWQLTVLLDDSSSQAMQVDPDADGSASVALSPAVLPRVVSVEVRDPVGNGGLLAVP